MKVLRASRCVIAVALTVTACADVVTSKPIGINTPVSSATQGLGYGLPKGQILLTARRAPADLGALNTAKATAQKAVSDAQGAVKSGEKPTDAQAAAIAAATGALQAAQANLDTYAPNGKPTMQETITLTALPFVPDPNYRYVADFNHRPWRDDNLRLSVQNGLLTSSNITSQDQAGQIVQSVATSILSVVGLGPSLLPDALKALGNGQQMSFDFRPSLQPEAPKRPQNCQYALMRVFDPVSAKDIRKVNDDLAAARSGGGLSISVQIPGTGGLSTVTDTKEEELRPELVNLTSQQNVNTSKSPSAQQVPDSVRDAQAGLVYRMAMPVVITAEYASSATDESAACRVPIIPNITPATVIVPDSRPGAELSVRATAGWLTTTTIGLTFANGMLTDRSLQRPSEILALVSIPANIISQYVSILTSFLQLKVNYATADATIAAQQAAALGSRITQLENATKVALASTIGNATAQLALLQLQQQIQAVKVQLGQTASP
jgi:hypothetical protein